jgi:hypothetical protein
MPFKRKQDAYAGKFKQDTIFSPLEVIKYEDEEV